MTPAQLITFKAAILAETDPTLAQLRDEGSTGAVAEWYSKPSTVVVWSTTTPLSDISNAVTWANLTPNDAPDGTLAWQCRSLACQGKQFNLQLIFGAQGQVSTGRANVRSGLQDALTNIPSGVAGATMAAGWAAVRSAMQRFANRGEAVFSTGTGTAGSPGDLVYEGGISNTDVVDALRS